MTNFYISTILGATNIALSYSEDNNWFFWTGIVLLIMAASELHEALSDD
jgi:hypothetical protein